MKLYIKLKSVSNDRLTEYRFWRCVQDTSIRLSDEAKCRLRSSLICIYLALWSFGSWILMKFKVTQFPSRKSLSAWHLFSILLSNWSPSPMGTFNYLPRISHKTDKNQIAFYLQTSTLQNISLQQAQTDHTLIIVLLSPAL